MGRRGAGAPGWGAADALDSGRFADFALGRDAPDERGGDLVDFSAQRDLVVEFTQRELDAVVSKALRVVLGAGRPVELLELRRSFAGDQRQDKRLLDLALLALADQGVLARHGHGAWALFSVPEAAAPAARALAYAEFGPAADDAAGAAVAVAEAEAFSARGGGGGGGGGARLAAALPPRAFAPARAPCGAAAVRRLPTPGGGPRRPRSATKRARGGDDSGAVAAKRRAARWGGGAASPGGPAPMSP